MKDEEKPQIKEYPKSNLLPHKEKLDMVKQHRILKKKYDQFKSTKKSNESDTQ